MLKGGLTVDHTTVERRWVVAYAPQLDKRCRHKRAINESIVASKENLY